MSAPIAMKHLELFSEWHKYKNLTRSELCCRLKEFVHAKTNMNYTLTDDTLMKFIKNVELRWKTCYRDVKKFQSRNSEWLDSVFDLSSISEPSTSKVGRPVKIFDDCGVRSKQLKTNTLCKEHNLEELSFATQTQLRKAGKRSAASVLRDITSETSPKRAHTHKKDDKFKERNTDMPIAYTAEEALSLIMNAMLTKHQYLVLRSEAKARHVNIYPSWHKILEAKKSCYPEPTAIKINENSAEIKLQNILDITAKRICQLQEDVLKTLPKKITNLTMICKWGCDGSSGQSNYKQRFSIGGQDDSSIFIISFVPLQLYYATSDDCKEKVVIWQNPTPSSTRFCRAIKFIFAQETLDRTKQETQAMQQQVAALSPTCINESIKVDYKLILTMVDGKVCNALTNTSSTQVCYICKAKPSEMNNLDRVAEKMPVTENYTFGLSTLHSWIRFFECCLHISYRLEVKTWQIRGPSKIEVNVRKKEIVDKFRKELGVLVDQPKPGYGSTNDGNTARAFFRNPKLSSSITGLDEKLIERFGIILKTMSCGYTIDTDKFDKFAKETAQLFIEKYPWFYMPTSVHKVLVHGARVIEHAILPIGQLSEEAQEAKHKEFKYVREHHTRKSSRLSTSQDLINYLILSSDPIISYSSYKNKKYSKNYTLCPKVLSLLKEPEIHVKHNDSDCSETNED